MQLISIRAANTGDVDEIAEIFSESYRLMVPDFPELHSFEDDRHFVRHNILPRSQVVVAVVGGHIVGFAAFDWCWVQQLYVSPRSWRCGIGTNLMETMKAARPGGLQLWCFYDNSRGRAFYARQGFWPLRFTDGAGNDEGLADVLYHWRRVGGALPVRHSA